MSFSNPEVATAGFNMLSFDESALKSAISAKLNELSALSDDVLPEYILVMVQNKKSKPQIAQDLDAFLGKDAPGFADWLWGTLASLSGQQSNSSSFQTSTTQRKEGTQQRILSAIVAPAQEEWMTDTIDRGGSRASYDSRRSFGRSHRDRRSSSSTSESGMHIDTNGGTPAGPSRLVLSAVKQAAASTKRTATESQPTRRYVLPKKQVASDGTTSSIASRPTRAHSNGNSDVDNDVLPDSSSSSSTAVEHDYEGVSFTVTLSGTPRRGTTGGRKRSQQQRSEMDTEIMDNESNNNNNHYSANNTHKKKKKVKKIICAYWPNCQRGESCLFHHPSEPCTNFPNCPYGSECLFIHPSIPCKFGASCSRVGCAFHHPSASSVWSGDHSSSFHGPVPCRSGYACANVSCKFAHPVETCRFGTKCTKGSACKYSHAPPCRYGAACTKAGCTFSHSGSVRNKGVALCKFGALCAFKDTTCKYSHSPAASNDITNTDNDTSIAVNNDSAQVAALSETLPPSPTNATLVINTDVIME